MHKSLLVLVIMLAATSASAQEIVLSCQIGPPDWLIAKSQGQDIPQTNEIYKINNSEIQGSSKNKSFHVTTSDDEYQWTDDMQVVTLKNSINRYSGQFLSYSTMNGKTIPFAKGQCQKVDRAF